MTIFGLARSGTRTWKRGRRRWSLGAVAAFASLLPSGPAQSATVHEMVASDGRFDIFAAALRHTPLWERLRQETSVTLFLPSDKALRDEGSAFLLEQVLIAKSNEKRLQEVLSFHVYPGLQLAPEAIGNDQLASLGGACFLLARSGSGLRIGPEAAVTGYLAADNGGIYVIDRLLWQPWTGDRRCADAHDVAAGEPVATRSQPVPAGPSHPR